MCFAQFFTFIIIHLNIIANIILCLFTYFHLNRYFIFIINIFLAYFLVFQNPLLIIEFFIIIYQFSEI